MICDTIRLMLVMSLAASCKAHVALTFPPARQPALDFLDSARTPPPCGVPKGKPFHWPIYSDHLIVGLIIDTVAVACL